MPLLRKRGGGPAWRYKSHSSMGAGGRSLVGQDDDQGHDDHKGHDGQGDHQGHDQQMDKNIFAFYFSRYVLMF